MTRSDLYADYQALLQHACLCTETNMVTRARDLQAFAFFENRVSSTTQRRAAIIGFAGPKGCGKSTVAEALRTSLIPECITAYRYRFAQPIKDMARALGLTTEQIDGSEKETPCDLLGGCTPRYVMQTLGTQWGRDTIGPDLWVNATMARVDAEPHAIALIDDVRFLNEVAAIKARGGHVIELCRRGVLYDATIPSGADRPDPRQRDRPARGRVGSPDLRGEPTRRSGEGRCAVTKLGAFNSILKWTGFVLVRHSENGKPDTFRLTWIGLPPDRAWARHCERTKADSP